MVPGAANGFLRFVGYIRLHTLDLSVVIQGKSPPNFQFFKCYIIFRRVNGGFHPHPFVIMKNIKQKPHCRVDSRIDRNLPVYLFNGGQFVNCPYRITKFALIYRQHGQPKESPCKTNFTYHIKPHEVKKLYEHCNL